MSPATVVASAKPIRSLREWVFGAAVLCTFADYVGLAILQPALPFYLSELVADEDVVMWNGYILSAQFIAIVFGNIFWGCVGDRLTSQNVLCLAMIGDCLTFCLTSFIRSPVLLVVVRFLAGLSTPLTPALLFIFERAPTPAAALKGVGQYVLAINFAYLTGGILVSSLNDSVGFLGLNLIATSLAATALLFTVLLATPSLVGKKSRPRGVWHALLSPPFMCHAMIAYSSGWAFNANVIVPFWILRDQFGWDASRVGLIYVLLPFLLVVMEKLVRCSAGHVGSNAVISTGMFLQLGVLATCSLPAVQANLPALIACVCLIFANLITQMLPNQSKPRQIADGYATNATGAVTGAGRVCFALGQGTAPIILAAAYDYHPSLPYAIWEGVQVCQLLTLLLCRQPLCRDETPMAPDGSRAAQLKASVAAELAAAKVNTLLSTTGGPVPALATASAELAGSDDCSSAASSSSSSDGLAVGHGGANLQS